MSDIESKKFIIVTLAKGSTAELNNLIERCDDRDTGRSLYDALMTLTNKLSRKFQFSLTRDDKSDKSQSGRSLT